MQAHATEEQVRAVCERIESFGYRAHAIPGAQRTAIGITGNKGAVEQSTLEEMPGVGEVIRVSKPYKLVSRDVKAENTIVRFPDSPVTIGGRDLVVMAGPCSIESHEQAFATAERVHAAGAQFFRGGAYKPRTSPYAFQGLGEEGLRIMAEVRDRFGLLIVTEAIDNESLELVEEYADMIQIGARNMQNYSLLKRAGRSRKPVLLKRGLSATLEEFLMAAEYIMSEGNYNVVLCERGVRTFADHTRNTLDLSIVPAVQRLSPSAHHRRSQPRHRQARQSHSHDPRRRSLRCRRAHHRSPPRARPGALRRYPIALPRTVRAPHVRGQADRAGAGPHASAQDRSSRHHPD